MCGVPALLQSFLYQAGYAVHVKDISAIGTNVANSIGRAARENWGDESLFIRTYHPNTDPSYDVLALKAPLEVPSSKPYLPFGFSSDYPDGLLAQIKIAAREVVLNRLESAPPVSRMLDFLKRVLRGPETHFRYDEAGKRILKSNALSPLDSVGYEFFREWQILQWAAIAEVTHSLLFALPPSS